MKTVIITDASYTADEKSIVLFTFIDKDVKNNPEHLGIKEEYTKHYVEIGEENWEEENEDAIREIVKSFLSEKEMTASNINDFNVD